MTSVILQIILMSMLGAGAAYAMGNKGASRPRLSGSMKTWLWILIAACVIVVMVILFAPTGR